MKQHDFLGVWSYFLFFTSRNSHLLSLHGRAVGSLFSEGFSTGRESPPQPSGLGKRVRPGRRAWRVAQAVPHEICSYRAALSPVKEDTTHHMYACKSRQFFHSSTSDTINDIWIVLTSLGLYPQSCLEYSGLAISLSNRETPSPKAAASLDFTTGPS